MYLTNTTFILCVSVSQRTGPGISQRRDVRVNNDGDPTTSYKDLANFCPVSYGRNLASFRPATPDQFTRLNCAQQASISTRVSLTAFARGSTARPRGLHSRPCRLFLVIIEISTLTQTPLNVNSQTREYCIASCAQARGTSSVGARCRLVQHATNNSQLKPDVYNTVARLLP